MKTLTSITIRVILIFVVWAGSADAAIFARSYHHYPNDLGIATGAIEVIARNTVQIYDEEQKRSRRFIYFEQTHGFVPRDYVRIYYRPETNTVQMIRKMTVLEYKRNGQNLGYILK
jgi:hypothetical protein